MDYKNFEEDSSTKEKARQDRVSVNRSGEGLAQPTQQIETYSQQQDAWMETEKHGFTHTFRSWKTVYENHDLVVMLSTVNSQSRLRLLSGVQYMRQRIDCYSSVVQD